MNAIVRNSLLCASLALLCGCASPKVINYQPQIGIDSISADAVAPVNSYLLAKAEQTRGRFACGMAIARMTLPDRENRPGLVLSEIEPADQAWWYEILRGVSLIRELTFLTPITARVDGSSPERLCRLAQRMDAALLLVYADNQYGPNAAQRFGVVYETGTHEIIATLHASARILNEDGLEESPYNKRGEHRELDARFQASRNFERHLLAAVRELIHRDSPTPATQPHPWQTDPNQRWWLPQRLRAP